MRSVLLIAALLLVHVSFGQSSNKLAKYFGETFRPDSDQVILIPIQYNQDLFSSKFSYEDYYANIVFFNSKDNSQKKLFEKDTFIKPFRDRHNYYYYREDQKTKPINIRKSNLFFLVKNVDYDNNGKIDETDPYILYVTDLHGNNLKSLTPLNENVMSFEFFEDMNFMLIRMQRDSNKNREFTYKDKDFYYLKVDLHTFNVVAKIEL